MPYYIFSIAQMISLANGGTEQGANISSPDTNGTSAALYQDEVAALNALANAGFVPISISGYGPMKEYLFKK